MGHGQPPSGTLLPFSRYIPALRLEQGFRLKSNLALEAASAPQVRVDSEPGLELSGGGPAPRAREQRQPQ